MAICLLLPALLTCGRDQDRRYFCKDAMFSIVLPQTRKISENQKGTRILAEIPDDDDIYVIRQNINVVIEEIKAPVSLEEYVGKQKDGLRKLRGVKILTTGEASIDGSLAKWLTYSYTIHDFGYQAVVYVLNKNSRYYIITGISQVNTFHKYENRFHAIARSFKFE